MPVTRIIEFDTWRPGYGLATVYVYRAGTTTLAAIFTDEDCTIAATNPQTLEEKTVNDVSYGKFTSAIYTEQAYYLGINSIDETGITRPTITGLDGEDAALAVVTPEGASTSSTLAEHLARRVDVRDHGSFLDVTAIGASAAANTTALTAALGVASADGGGYVDVPAGVFQISPISIPLGVTLRGIGRGATTLQSTQAGKIVTLSGARAGLARLTLDGVTKVANSTGVYGVALARNTLDDVEIKRFETGLHMRGAEAPLFTDLVVSDCSYGAKLHGDLDVAVTNAGSSMVFPRWEGGRVEYCSIAGIELKNVDTRCVNGNLRDIGFVSNTGSALKIVGGRSVSVAESWFEANTVAVEIADGSPETTTNSVIDVRFSDCRFVTGEMSLTGTLESVLFSRCDLETIAITLTTPENNVLAVDCRETDCTLSGIATAWLRAYENRDGASAGVTTGNVATKAWAISLEAGQAVYLVARVIGRGRNSTDSGFYHIAVSARRPGASLAYDVQTGQFTVGNILTGGTSGATGRIIADSDAGSTGTLTLQDVSGTFTDNEIITDGTTGSATANGTQSYSNAALVGSVTSIRPAQETDADFDATFVANGPEIELRVTGDTSKTVEWVAHVDVVST